MRLALLLLCLAGLAFAAPTAQAQMTQYNVVLQVTPPSDAFTADVSTLIVEGRVQFVGDPTYALSLTGIPVEYVVTAAPAWLAVTASPSNDVIPISHPTPNVQGSRSFALSMSLAEKPEGSRVDLVEITATVRPTSPGATPKSVSTSIPIAFYAPEADEEECTEEHLTATYAFSPETEESASPAPEDDDLIVQSGNVTPVSTWYAIGGFGLVGAAVGLLVLRRRSR